MRLVHDRELDAVLGEQLRERIVLRPLRHERPRLVRLGVGLCDLLPLARTITTRSSPAHRSTTCFGAAANAAKTGAVPVC
jgi:hypothetical protein